MVRTDSMLLSAFPLSDFGCPLLLPTAPGPFSQKCPEQRIKLEVAGKDRRITSGQIFRFRMLEAIQDCDFLAKDCTSSRLG